MKSLNYVFWISVNLFAGVALAGTGNIGSGTDNSHRLKLEVDELHKENNWKIQQQYGHPAPMEYALPDSDYDVEGKELFDQEIISDGFSSYEEAYKELQEFLKNSETLILEAEKVRADEKTLFSQRSEAGFQRCYDATNLITKEERNCVGVYPIETKYFAGYEPGTLGFNDNPSVVTEVDPNDSTKTSFRWKASLNYVLLVKGKGSFFIFDKGILDARVWSVPSFAAINKYMKDLRAKQKAQAEAEKKK